MTIQYCMTQLRHAGTYQSQCFTFGCLLCQKCPDARFQRYVVLVGVTGKEKPFIHDRLRAYIQMVIVLGELGGGRENGVTHCVEVFAGTLQSVSREKTVVYLLPHTVGVDQSTVQIKQLHIQNLQGKSTASSA